MVSIEGRLYDRSVCQFLCAYCWANGRIESLQEALGGGHKHRIQGSGGADLGVFDDIGLDAGDLGGGTISDIPVAEVGTRCENLLVS